MPGSSAPGTASCRGAAPVAMSSLSYCSRRPSASSTWRDRGPPWGASRVAGALRLGAAQDDTPVKPLLPQRLCRAAAGHVGAHDDDRAHLTVPSGPAGSQVRSTLLGILPACAGAAADHYVIHSARGRVMPSIRALTGGGRRGETSAPAPSPEPVSHRD